MKEKGEDNSPKDTDAGMDHEGDQVHSQSVLIGKDRVTSQVADAELGQPRPMKDLNKEKHHRAGEEPGQCALEKFFISLQFFHGFLVDNLLLGLYLVCQNKIFLNFQRVLN